MKMKGTAQLPSLPLKRNSHIRLLSLGPRRLRAQAGNTNSRIAPEITQCRQLASSSRDCCHLAAQAAAHNNSEVLALMSQHWSHALQKIHVAKHEYHKHPSILAHPGRAISAF